MTIARQRKITIFGLSKDQSRVLNGLQDLGCMHVLPLVPPPKEIEKVVSPKAEQAYKALRFLSSLETTRRQIRHKPDFDVDALVEEITQLRLDLRRASDKKALIQHRLDEIEPWGNIVYPTKQTIQGICCWYYQVPLSKTKHLSKVKYPWQIVHKDHKFAYTVLLSDKEPSPDAMPVSRTHLGSQSKTELLSELEKTELLLDELDTRRYGLSRFIYLLTVHIAEADDKAALMSAAQKSLKTEHLVAVQGWVPLQDVERVQEFAATHHLACITEKAAKGEEPPTLLEQPKKLEAAKDLAMFYQVPNYYGWDPSKLLFISFSLFFAMILADAGYGLLLLLGIMVYWKKFAETEKGKAYRLLCLSLTISTTTYGALVGSYFGVTPSDASVLSTLHILNINDFDIMMKISIVVGAIHIGIANISMALVYRHSLVALAKLGWLGVIYAGLLYWLAGGQPLLTNVSYGLGAIGAAAIVLFSSERPIHSFKDHLLRILDGIFGLKGLLTAFGDVLSYMRLFALGLASASLAITFNDLAADAYQNIAGGGLFIAILIVFIGHLLNLVLSIMSGVVHGLRLNYIEFYNWGQKEEGTAFETFSRTEMQDERK